jgi:6-phosphogluconolactonase
MHTTGPQVTAFRLPAAPLDILLATLLCVLMSASPGCRDSGNPPTRVIVTPASASIPLGLSQRFTAVATYADGSSIDVTSSATWSSSSTSVAHVFLGQANSGGCINKSSPGLAIISADLNGVTGSASLTVTGSALIGVSEIEDNLGLALPPPVEVGGSVYLHLRGFYSGQQCMPPLVYLQAAWTSSDPAVMTVNDGLVTGVSVGRATIFARVVTYAGPVTRAMTMSAYPAVARLAAVANAGSDDVSVFASGRGSDRSVVLSPVPGSPFAAGSRPSAVVTVPSSRFLYVANAGSNDVSAFVVDATTGSLTVIAGSPFHAGGAPSAMMASGDGSFLHVANGASNDISGFRIESDTGALTPVAGSPFAAGSHPSALALSGAFLYAANAGSDEVSAYTVDAATGALVPLAGAPFKAGPEPLALTIDATGSYLYTVNRGDGTVSGFVIDGSSGRLSPLGAPVPALSGLCPGSHASSVSASPSGTLFVGVANGVDACTTALSVVALTARIDPSTGSLATGWGVSLSSSSHVQSAAAVAADTSGRFAYVAEDGDGLLLSALDPYASLYGFYFSSPPSTGAAPSALAVIK